MQSPERALKEAEMCPGHRRWSILEMSGKQHLPMGLLGELWPQSFFNWGEKTEQLIIVDKKFCFILTILLTLKGTHTGHDMKREGSLSNMVYLSNSVFMPGRMRLILIANMNQVYWVYEVDLCCLCWPTDRRNTWTPAMGDSRGSKKLFTMFITPWDIIQMCFGTKRKGTENENWAKRHWHIVKWDEKNVVLYIYIYFLFSPYFLGWHMITWLL